ncbi:MAG: hypothetical protein DRJ35_00030 [Thermoprotei archaeon]|nr:MAG: hypothetical protein DRJ35_00030 [Thermoprotei archaeon]
MPNSMEILKKISAQLWWSPHKNIPVLEGSREKTLLKVKATPPVDARPIFGFFYKDVYRIIEEYFGGNFSSIIPRRKIVLGNKVQYPDYGEEIIIDGQIVGHIIYDLSGKRWRFRPLYISVYKMVKEKTGYYAITSLPKIVRGYEIHRSDIISSNIPENDEYIAVASKDLSYLGIGVKARRNRIYVLKSWRKKPYAYLEGDPTWRDVISENLERLIKLEKEAIAFIRKVYEEYRLPVFVSFSGGKDSLVTLHLVEKALGRDFLVVFNDTGIEFPETVEYVKRIVQREGLKLIIADAGDKFWRGAKIMGPPARDFRWCCKVTKFAPLARELKKIYPEAALSFVGIRKYESSQRARSSRVWRNKWLPKIIAATPILDWTALDIWLYILWKKLLPNKLYYHGFDRIGCWLCPASEMGEFELAKRVNRQIYEAWNVFLKEYKEKEGYPDEWLKYGLWRWIEPPKDILRYLGKKEKFYQERRGANIRIVSEEGKLKIIVKKSVIPLAEEKFLNISKSASLDRTQLNIEKLGEDELTILVTDRRKLESVTRISIRAYHCSECLECANWCPKNAISLDKALGGIKIAEDKCTSCNLCNIKCPMVEYTFKLMWLKEEGRK